MRLKILGAVLLVGLALTSAAQDRSRRALDLVYDDVQLLKEQVMALQARLERNAEEIAAIGDQLKLVGDLVRQSMSDQAGLKEGLRAVPAQYQNLVHKIDQLTIELQRISAELAAARAPAPVAQEEKPPDKPPSEPAPKKAPESKPPPAPPPPSVSPQESYAMAYNDFLRGNYDLAIESFKFYRQNFPASPLADNALYWIGECYYSQRKFEQAIDAFDEVILAYPQGDVVAAAFLKKGLSFVELGRTDEALATFRLLTAKYPLEEESRIAQDKIKELTKK